MPLLLCINPLQPKIVTLKLEKLDIFIKYPTYGYEYNRLNIIYDKVHFSVF